MANHRNIFVAPDEGNEVWRRTDDWRVKRWIAWMMMR